MRFALFKEVPKRQRRKKRKMVIGVRKGGEEDADGSSEDESDDIEGGDEREQQRVIIPAVGQTNQTQDPIWGENGQDVQMDVDLQQARASSEADGKLTQSRFVEPEKRLVSSASTDYIDFRLQFFRTRLANLFATRLQDTEEIFLNQLLEFVNEGLPVDQLYGTAEATAACSAMQENDELMISGGIVYKM